MRILFFHENFPGRFGTLASWLAAENEVLFASFFQRRDFSIPGVRRVVLRVSDPRLKPGERTYAQGWCRIANGGAPLFGRLEKLNEEFAPQIIFSSTFGGFTLFVQPAFPAAFHVFYAGWQGGSGGDGAMRARMSAQWIEILQSNLCFAFSEETRHLFPAPLRPVIHPVVPWVETGFMSRAEAHPFAADGFEPGPDMELVSINVKGVLGSPGQMEGLFQLSLGLLKARPRCAVLFNHGPHQDGEPLRAWRERLPEDTRRRICVADSLTLATYRDMLCASAIHVCPEKQPVFLMEKLETMSCETVLMTPAPHDGRFFRPGANMLDYPARSAQAQLEAILRALERPSEREAIAKAARSDVVASFSPQALIPSHAGHVLEEYRKWSAAKGKFHA